MVLISDFVNRNKVVITFLAIEARDAKLLMLDLRVAFGVVKEVDNGREMSLMSATEIWSASNPCMLNEQVGRVCVGS